MIHPAKFRLARLVLWPLLLIGAVLGCATTASAGTGGIVNLPTAGTKIRSGLKIQIDTRWVDGTGYRPVRMRVSSIPAGPAPADRSIRITLRPRGWRMGTVRASVTKIVELPQGAMFSDVTVSVPHYEMWNNFDVETSEDGDRLRDLCVRYVGLPSRNFYNWSEAMPAILVLDRDAPAHSITSSIRRARPNSSELPDIRALASRVPLNSYNSQVTQGIYNTSKAVDDSDILRFLVDLPRLEILRPEDLPDRWIDLTCVDMILVSLDEVARIREVLPARWQAIQDWQASGATLCVFGAGEGYERLDELERSIGAPPLPVDPRRPYARGWTEPKSQRHTVHVNALSEYSGNVAYYNNQGGVAEETTVPDEQSEPPGPRRFLTRTVRQGALVAIAAENPFPGEPQEWAWLLNSLTQDRWMWYRRHGLSMHRENPDYWDLLIPGVGEAPVNSFLVLISLFVIIIGPVNYFMLHRQRRLYLILLTVPLGAIIVTGSLLIYALLTDGLGVRHRTRSVTEIDQLNHHVVSWSRQSYYAGLSPADGLSFPADAAVYPVEHRPVGNPTRDGRQQLIWEDQQRLASGYLTTRSTKQFLVVESRSTDVGLTIDETSDPPQVTNRLGVQVDHLILRTSAGELYAASVVEIASTAGLTAITDEDASDQWSALLSQHRPAFPEGFDPYDLENAADFFETYDYSQYVDQGLPPPSFKASIFERRVRELTSVRFRGLPPRTYLAAVAQPVEVSLGIADSRAEAGFHLVIGRW